MNKEETNFYNSELPSLSLKITKHIDGFVMNSIELKAKGHTYLDIKNGLNFLIEKLKEIKQNRK